MIIYLGIIDILQSYRFRKKVEHTVKSIIADGVSVGGCGGSLWYPRWGGCGGILWYPGCGG